MPSADFDAAAKWLTTSPDASGQSNVIKLEVCISFTRSLSDSVFRCCDPYTMMPCTDLRIIQIRDGIAETKAWDSARNI